MAVVALYPELGQQGFIDEGGALLALGAAEDALCGDAVLARGVGTRDAGHAGLAAGVHREGLWGGYGYYGENWDSLVGWLAG